MSKAPITHASVHPLVLLSIVDHYNRVNLKQRNKRVVGALLGIFFLIKVMLMTKMSKSSIAMLYLSKKIPVNQAFGFWIICIMNQCSIWWRRSVKKKNSLDGTQLEILSKLMTFKSTKFSENITIDLSF